MSNISTNALSVKAGKPGLFVQVEGGSLLYNAVVTQIAEVDLALTANTTNYVFVTASTVVIGSNTSGFTTAQLPLATVVTKNSGVYTITDKRPDFLIGNGLGSGVSSVASADGSIEVTPAATGDVDLSVDASAIVEGLVGLTYGGTNANLSAGGGAVATTGKYVIKQDASHVITSAALIATDIPDISATYQATSGLHVAGATGYPAFVAAPAAHNSTGAAGSLAVDATGFYICYATGAWVKITANGGAFSIIF